jgi:hypothetical protein
LISVVAIGTDLFLKKIIGGNWRKKALGDVFSFHHGIVKSVDKPVHLVCHHLPDGHPVH